MYFYILIFLSYKLDVIDNVILLDTLDNDLKSKSQVDIRVPPLYTILLIFLFVGQGIYSNVL